jgi:hypothetical protein
MWALGFKHVLTVALPNVGIRVQVCLTVALPNVGIRVQACLTVALPNVNIAMYAVIRVGQATVSDMIKHYFIFVYTMTLMPVT